MRLRWVGDHTGRLTLRDLVVFAQAAITDDRTRLWQAAHPGELAENRRLAIDSVNLAWMQSVLLAQLGGDKTTRFRPLYAPAGTIWADLAPKSQPALAGGYVEMTESETLDWLTTLPAYAGRALPVTPTPGRQ